jgi:hypothetical protein
MIPVIGAKKKKSLLQVTGQSKIRFGTNGKMDYVPMDGDEKVKHMLPDQSTRPKATLQPIPHLLHGFPYNPVWLTLTHDPRVHHEGDSDCRLDYTMPLTLAANRLLPTREMLVGWLQLKLALSWKQTLKICNEYVLEHNSIKLKAKTNHNQSYWFVIDLIHFATTMLMFVMLPKLNPSTTLPATISVGSEEPVNVDSASMLPSGVMRQSFVTKRWDCDSIISTNAYVPPQAMGDYVFVLHPCWVLHVKPIIFEAPQLYEPHVMAGATVATPPNRYRMYDNDELNHVAKKQHVDLHNNLNRREQVRTLRCNTSALFAYRVRQFLLPCKRDSNFDDGNQYYPFKVQGLVNGEDTDEAYMTRALEDLRRLIKSMRGGVAANYAWLLEGDIEFTANKPLVDDDVPLPPTAKTGQVEDGVTQAEQPVTPIQVPNPVQLNDQLVKIDSAQHDTWAMPTEDLECVSNLPDPVPALDYFAPSHVQSFLPKASSGDAVDSAHSESYESMLESLPAYHTFEANNSTGDSSSDQRLLPTSSFDVDDYHHEQHMDAIDALVPGDHPYFLYGNHQPHGYTHADLHNASQPQQSNWYSSNVANAIQQMWSNDTANDSFAGLGMDDLLVDEIHHSEEHLFDGSGEAHLAIEPMDMFPSTMLSSNMDLSNVTFPSASSTNELHLNTNNLLLNKRNKSPSSSATNAMKPSNSVMATSAPKSKSKPTTNDDSAKPPRKKSTRQAEAAAASVQQVASNLPFRSATFYATASNVIKIWYLIDYVRNEKKIDPSSIPQIVVEQDLVSVRAIGLFVSDYEQLTSLMPGKLEVFQHFVTRHIHNEDTENQHYMKLYNYNSGQTEIWPFPLASDADTTRQFSLALTEEPLRSYLVDYYYRESTRKRGLESPASHPTNADADEWLYRFREQKDTYHKTCAITGVQHEQLLDAYYWSHLAPVKKPEYEAILRFYEGAGLQIKLKNAYTRTGTHSGRCSSSGRTRNYAPHRKHAYAAPSAFIIQAAQETPSMVSTPMSDISMQSSPGAAIQNTPLMPQSTRGDRVAVKRNPRQTKSRYCDKLRQVNQTPFAYRAHGVVDEKNRILYERPPDHQEYLMKSVHHRNKTMDEVVYQRRGGLLGKKLPIVHSTPSTPIDLSKSVALSVDSDYSLFSDIVTSPSEFDEVIVHTASVAPSITSMSEITSPSSANNGITTATSPLDWVGKSGLVKKRSFYDMHSTTSLKSSLIHSNTSHVAPLEIFDMGSNEQPVFVQLSTPSKKSLPSTPLVQ